MPSRLRTAGMSSARRTSSSNCGDDNPLPARPPGCAAPPDAERRQYRRLLLIGPSSSCVYIVHDNFRELIAAGQWPSIYCGASSVPGKSYCPEHAARCSAGIPQRRGDGGKL